jgi:hypothetical protein
MVFLMSVFCELQITLLKRATYFMKFLLCGLDRVDIVFVSLKVWSKFCSSYEGTYNFLTNPNIAKFCFKKL